MKRRLYDKSCALSRRLSLPPLVVALATLAFAGTSAIAAQTDSLYIQDAAGVTTTNYPVQIGRPFVQGEIQNYPQIGICTDSTCATVSQWLTTQADVKQHWSDGSVKHAVLSFYVPKLNGNSTVYFKVQNQLSCNCGVGLTRAQMLGSNFNFDATETYTSGVSATISARAILSAWDGATEGVTGPVYYWAQGANATTLIIADHRNNQTCNGHACSSNDFGSDANKSLRPEFHVTFWPLTNQVKIRFVGEIVNTEAMQDQTYDLSLSVGATSPAVVYTQTAITEGVATRWTVDRNNQTGQNWTVSTPGGNIPIQKEIWLGGAPSPAAINHNLAYINGTYFTPNYDLTTVPNESTLESDWASFANSAPTTSIKNSGGYWYSGMADTGASPWIGPLPQWVMPWLYTGDIRGQELAIRVTELEGQYGEHIVEGKTGKDLLRTDPSAAGTGVGHVLSVSSRPTFIGNNWNYGSTAPADKITPVGSADSAGWIADEAHEPDFGSTIYALTGDYFFLQEELFAASYYSQMRFPDSGQWYGCGPSGVNGGFLDDDPRSTAWYLRAMATASFVAPDADFGSEQTYFTTQLNDFIAIEEGARCGSGDIYSWCSSSPFHGNPNWVWGYQHRALANNQGNLPQGTAYPPLHQWFSGTNSPTFVDGDYGTAGEGYGLNAVPGTGTITTSGTSSTVTFSNPSDCAAMHAGTVLQVTPDGGGNYGSNNVHILTVSCPTATIDSSQTWTNGGTPWVYNPFVGTAINSFSQMYLMYSLGRTTELGFPAANLKSWFAQLWTGLVNDPGSNPRLAFVGRMPVIDVTTGTYITAYSRLKQGYTPAWQTLASGFAPGGGGNPPINYPAVARAAYSVISTEPGGDTAWAWYQANVNTDVADFATNPLWALLPRSSTASSGQPTEATGNKCDLNNDGIVNVLDVELAVAQATGVLPCNRGTCSSSDVASVLATALGGTCDLQ